MAFKVLILAACLAGTFAVEHAYFQPNLGLLQSNLLGTRLQRKNFDPNANIDLNQLQRNQFQKYQSEKLSDLPELKQSQLELIDEENKEKEAIPRYTFFYSVHDEKTGDIKEQKETRVGDHVKGFYSMKEADGRHRRVEYQADDKSGFNAVVTHEGEAKIEAEPTKKIEEQEPAKSVLAAESSQKPIYILNVEKPQRQFQVPEAPKLTLAEIISLLETQESRQAPAFQRLPQLLISEENLEKSEAGSNRYVPPQSAERREHVLARSLVRFTDENSRFTY